MSALPDRRKRCYIDLCLPFFPHPLFEPSKKPKLPYPPPNHRYLEPLQQRLPATDLRRSPPITPLLRPVHAPQRILKAFSLGPSHSSRRTPPDWGRRNRRDAGMGNLGSRLFRVKKAAHGDDGNHGGLGLEDYRRLVVRVQEGPSAVSDLRSADVPPKVGFWPPAVSDLRFLTQEDEGPPNFYVLNRRVEDARKVVLRSMLSVAEGNAWGWKGPLHKDPCELFSPLTDEEENIVFDAMHGGKSHEVLVTHEASNIEITREVLQCLSQGVWLNDEVINLYLELLKEREKREPKRFLKCHFFNTFFYKKLISGRSVYDFKAVRRWTSNKKLAYGLIECDKIFVPIHKNVHWCLAVINVKEKSFVYLDSLGGMDTAVLRILAKYFMDEVKDKSDKHIDTMCWKQETVGDLPLQENGWDCGMFMLKYVDFYSQDLSLCFSQAHMPYFRKRTAKEILRLRAE